MIRFDKAQEAVLGGERWLMLRVMPECGPAVRCFLAGLKARLYVAELKEYRKRRSLDANAYLWVLLDKLSARLAVPKAELYRRLIPDIGGNSETVCIPTKGVDKLRAGWEHNGLGWVTDTQPSKLPGCTNVTLYYGSSAYDTEQMGRLIDLVVGECKAQGIETATPEELARLKTEWGTAKA